MTRFLLQRNTSGGFGKVNQDHRGTASGLLKLAAILVLFGSIAPRDAVAQGPAAVPDDLVLTQLVRATMTALNHANFTGNYTVLRALGAPSFRTANTPARLAGIFANLRNRNLELGPLLVFYPVFAPPPGFDERGRLRIRGYFPTRPLRINFDLTYEAVANRWRIFSITAGASPAPAANPIPLPPDRPPSRP